MKIQLPTRRSGPRNSERGVAVIIVIAFLAILLVYLATNLLTLSRLGRELSLLDQKQTRRLSREVVRTNFVPETNPSR
jgi:hypothetical protein